MSNLSELLPSGGGQNLVEFVASGTLPNGKPVILNSNGTVTVVGESAVPESVGTAKVFASAVTYYPKVTMLTATKALVVYNDDGNSGYGTACILNISGSTITASSEMVFNSAVTINIAVAALSETKAIVVYRDGGGGYIGTSIVLDVSGSTITAGSEVVFNNADTQETSVTMLDSTHAIVAYKDGGNSSYGTACVLSISGSTITAGSEVVFNSGDTRANAITLLTSTKALVTYNDFSNSYYGTSCVLTISGSSITAGSEAVFNTAQTLNISITALSSSKVVIAYCDAGSSSHGHTRVLDISGTTVTAGTSIVFNSGATGNTSLGSLSTTKAFLAYKDENNSDYGTYSILTISGSTVTASSSVVFNSASTPFSTAAVLGSAKAIVTYTNGGNSSHGTSAVVQLADNVTNLTATNLIGITSEATSSGGTAKINTWGGINEAQTSLTIASDYYAQTDGTITTATAGQKVGTAISATTINMKDLT